MLSLSLSLDSWSNDDKVEEQLNEAIPVHDNASIIRCLMPRSLCAMSRGSNREADVVVSWEIDNHCWKGCVGNYVLKTMMFLIG